jgi:hypothetical protein
MWHMMPADQCDVVQIFKVGQPALLTAAHSKTASRPNAALQMKLSMLLLFWCYSFGCSCCEILVSKLVQSPHVNLQV